MEVDDIEYGVDTERAVQMWKIFVCASSRLPDEGIGNKMCVDHQGHEVGPAPVEAIRWGQNLMERTAVNESVGSELGGQVRT